MTLYRKKPVVIEAMRLGVDCHDVDRILDANTRSLAQTLEGVMVAEPGDYIIRGVQGEFYPCKADIFESTYEAAE